MNRRRRLLSSFAIGATVMALGTVFGMRIGMAIDDTEAVVGTRLMVMAAFAEQGPSGLRDRYALAMDDDVLTIREEADLYAMMDHRNAVAGSSERPVRMRNPDAVDPLLTI